MNDDSLCARYFFANCTASFYFPDTMVISRKNLCGRYDIRDNRVFKPDPDLVSRFFDFVKIGKRVPSPDELLTI